MLYTLCIFVRVDRFEAPMISPNPAVGAGLVSARFGESPTVFRVPSRGTPTMAMMTYSINSILENRWGNSCQVVTIRPASFNTIS